LGENKNRQILQWFFTLKSKLYEFRQAKYQRIRK